MDITPRLAKGQQLIEAYGAGRFKIVGEEYLGSVIVMPEETMAWPVTSLAECTPHSLSAVFAAEPLPEIVVIGSGAVFTPMPAELRRAFREARIAVEMMDTGAACRTYNILLAEGRRVAAALIAL